MDRNKAWMVVRQYLNSHLIKPFDSDDALRVLSGGLPRELAEAITGVLAHYAILRSGLFGYMQHKERCAVGVCATCGHVLGLHDGSWQTGPTVEPVCGVFKPKPCTCGLDRILEGTCDS